MASPDCTFLFLPTDGTLTDTLGNYGNLGQSVGNVAGYEASANGQPLDTNTFWLNGMMAYQGRIYAFNTSVATANVWWQLGNAGTSAAFGAGTYGANSYAVNTATYTYAATNTDPSGGVCFANSTVTSTVTATQTISATQTVTSTSSVTATSSSTQTVTGTSSATTTVALTTLSLVSVFQPPANLATMVFVGTSTYR